MGLFMREAKREEDVRRLERPCRAGRASGCGYALEVELQYQPFPLDVVEPEVSVVDQAQGLVAVTYECGTSSGPP